MNQMLLECERLRGSSPLHEGGCHTLGPEFFAQVFQVEKDFTMQGAVGRFFPRCMRIAYSLRAAAAGIHLVQEVTGS